MINILITGSNGYVGSSLSTDLSSDYNVTSLTREDVDLLDPIDVDTFFIDKIFDVVLHCASVGGNGGISEDSTVTNHNLKMYQNISNNKKHFKKLISFGSGSELDSPTPYSLGKRLIRDNVINTPNFYNIRVYAVFDENELDRRFIKSNVMRCVNNEPMVIHQNKYMDFFYMGDLINLVRHYIIDDNPPKEIECSYKHKVTLEEITELIRGVSGKSIPTIFKNDGMDKIYVGNNLYLDDLPLTLIGLEEGIKRVYNYYK